MALSRSRRNDSSFNYWPGFVDALSTLVLAVVFLLSVFLVVQFFLSQEVTGKDKALDMFVVRQPMGRVGEPTEIAALATYLAADESAFTTGTAIPIDGGWII